MKNTVEVFWTPWVPTFDRMQQASFVLAEEPRPLISDLAKERFGPPKYFKCPAFVNFCHNTFVIRSPIDINIIIKNKSEVFTDRYGQDFFDVNVHNKSLGENLQDPLILGTFPHLLFYSHESVEVEVFDVALLHSNVSRNFRIVPGSFNIQKWIRPLECGFEVIEGTQVLEFKRGDPLFMVRFKTPKDKPVKLTQVVMDDKLLRAGWACISLKAFMPKLSLSRIYKIAENYLNAWRRSK